MNCSEIADLKLSIFAGLYQKNIWLPAKKLNDLSEFFIKRGDVLSFGEGGVTYLGDDLSTAIDALRASPEGRDIFGDDGLEGAGTARGQPKDDNGGDAAPLTPLQRAAHEANMTDAEFAAKSPGFRMQAFDRVQGPVKAAWQNNPKAQNYGGLSPEQVAQLSPEEKIQLGNAAREWERQS